MQLQLASSADRGRIKFVFKHEVEVVRACITVRHTLTPTNGQLLTVCDDDGDD